ncbi:sodium:solute symporter family protein [Gordonia sp. TBRC 11910]|uniref:Sodium:solute symporter family protein n=1 Tax=Gordonia asplenii TaxID=2725283 RepID=A0A848KRQ7_9ACTN|nr:sodium:solute symporter family protein [Gordonia asplenii]NMO01100.1 sodium:solute symporter family protein [Gordonia asplenii]
MLTVLIFGGIFLIGALGIVGRKATTMGEWTVSGRNLPRWTSWFLQAGESLTTFSFLGLAGIAFTGGLSATFAIAYLSIAAIGLYFVGPRIWRLGRSRGYISQADFFTDRFNSPMLGKLAAVVGALFLLPYLQLQLTGLGLIVELATGSKSGRGLSMVVASVLVIAFVAWAGIRGIARVAMLKDALMVIALVLVLVAVLISVGGVPHIFGELATHSPDLLTVNAPGYGTTFFLTSVIITGIGAGLNTFPHLWPPLFAAKTGAVLRDNYTWLGLYQFALFAPIIVGCGAILILPSTTRGNAVLLTTAHQTMPDSLVAVIAIAGAAAAMVPAAAIAMGISSLISQNLIVVTGERRKLRLNTVFVAAAVLLSLIFGLTNYDIAGLLLLTYGGLAQMAPGILFGLANKVKVGAVPIILGMITGVVVVGWLTFAHVDIGTWDSGLIALAPNLIVFAIAEIIRRSRTPAARGEVPAAGGVAEGSLAVDTP